MELQSNLASSDWQASSKADTHRLERIISFPACWSGGFSNQCVSRQPRNLKLETHPLARGRIELRISRVVPIVNRLHH